MSESTVRDLTPSTQLALFPPYEKGGGEEEGRLYLILELYFRTTVISLYTHLAMGYSFVWQGPIRPLELVYNPGSLQRPATLLAHPDIFTKPSMGQLAGPITIRVSVLGGQRSGGGRER